MKIKMLISGVSTKYGLFYPGTVLDMPETEAKNYIKHKAAMAVAKPAPQKPDVKKPAPKKKVQKKSTKG